MRIQTSGLTAILEGVLELLTPPYAATASRGAESKFPATLAELRKDLLPALVAVLIVLVALSVPVLCILWRLQRAYG